MVAAPLSVCLYRDQTFDRNFEQSLIFCYTFRNNSSRYPSERIFWPILIVFIKILCSLFFMLVIFSHKKIEEFIHSLGSKLAPLVYQVIGKLEKYGHLIRMPDSKSIGDGLLELRVRGAKQVRIIYFFHDNNAILLHIFVKKTWKLPKGEIEYAKKIWKMYLA